MTVNNGIILFILVYRTLSEYPEIIEIYNDLWILNIELQLYSLNIYF